MGEAADAGGVFAVWPPFSDFGHDGVLRDQCAGRYNFKAGGGSGFVQLQEGVFECTVAIYHQGDRLFSGSVQLADLTGGQRRDSASENGRGQNGEIAGWGFGYFRSHSQIDGVDLPGDFCTKNFCGFSGSAGWTEAVQGCCI